MENKNAEATNIEPFMRSDQYNFIKHQVKNIIHAHATVKDKDVIHAVKYNSLQKVLDLFPEAKEDEQALLEKIVELEKDIEAERFLNELIPYVIPFENVTEKTIMKLFPKAKKLKLPPLDEIDFKDISYLGWYDIRSEKKYLIANYRGKLTGIHGTFKPSVKGICTLCNSYEEVGLFMANIKTGRETNISRGNYICRDSQMCNENIVSMDKLNSFVELLKN
jgi:hypothetical protein